MLTSKRGAETGEPRVPLDPSPTPRRVSMRGSARSPSVDVARRVGLWPPRGVARRPRRTPLREYSSHHHRQTVSFTHTGCVPASARAEFAAHAPATDEILGFFALVLARGALGFPPTPPPRARVERPTLAHSPTRGTHADAIVLGQRHLRPQCVLVSPPRRPRGFLGPRNGSRKRPIWGCAPPRDAARPRAQSHPDRPPPHPSSLPFPAS